MIHRRQYTEEERQDVLQAYDNFGHQISKTDLARYLNIKRSTLCEWINRRERAKEQLKHHQTLEGPSRTARTYLETPTTHNTITTNDPDMALTLTKDLRATKIIKADGLYKITY